MKGWRTLHQGVGASCEQLACSSLAVLSILRQEDGSNLDEVLAMLLSKTVRIKCLLERERIQLVHLAI